MHVQKCIEYISAYRYTKHRNSQSTCTHCFYIFHLLYDLRRTTLGASRNHGFSINGS